MKYNEGYCLSDIFKYYESGITTHRDKVVINFKIEELQNILKNIISMETEEFRNEYKLPKDGRDWSIENSKAFLIKDIGELLSRNMTDSLILTDSEWDKIIDSRVIKLQYRPFDYRVTYYNKKSKGFIAYPRYELMQNFIDNENVGLMFSRQVTLNNYKHVFISNKVTESVMISNKPSERCYLAPLYSYNNVKIEEQSFITNEKVNAYTESYPNVNFNENFIEFISNKYLSLPTPEEILGYIYAVLYSRNYRDKFNEFLKEDFPRVPFVEDENQFMELAKLGTELIEVHLLKKGYYESSLGRYPIDGDNNVDKIKYDNENNLLYINKKQYFDNIPEEVWNMEIGAFKVLDKWLKYRRGRNLSFGDIDHFQKVVRSIDDTIHIMDKIDQLTVEFHI